MAEERSLPRWLVVGFTGHHKLDHPDKVTEVICKELNKLALLNPRLAGISSAASGADTLFAEEMLRRDCPTSLVLPFQCDRLKEDFTDDAGGWGRLQELMRNAIEIDIVHQASVDHLETAACLVDPSTANLKEASRQAYMEADYRCVDRADVTMAVWNEKEREEDGFDGTADAVHYAIQIGKPLIIINPETGTVTKERLPPPVHKSVIQAEAIVGPRNVVEQFFKSVDDLATVHAPKARQLIRWCLRLHLAASVLAAAAVVFQAEAGWAIAAAIVDVVVLIAAFTMLWFRGRSFELWLQHRAESEVCRSFLATWEIRRQANVIHQPRPELPQLKALFTTLRMLRQIDKSAKKSFEQVRSDYEENRIGDQLDYFRRKHKTSLAEYKSRKLMMVICTAGAVVCSVAVLILSIYPGNPALKQLMEFSAISLPLATTALGLLLITDESSRREVRYHEMIVALEYFEPRVKACRTWHSLARLATYVEEELLQELLEWRSFVKHTEHLH